ncbi:uncharacterized protein [Dermacentor albipictus]|uniref:uncharacterized protein n=1 Tax=Dermacentor albipictus TaxID=60249 RepID=UPI0031FD3948
MSPVVAMLPLIYLVALSSARAPLPRTHRTTMPPFTRQFSDLPDYDTYRFVERLRSEQARQLRAGGGRTNETSRSLLPSRMRPLKPVWLLLGNRSVRQDRGADSRRAADDSSSDVRVKVLQFMQDHQLIFYVACSCVLTGVVVLVTLMVLYGGHRGSEARSGMYGESYALLDRRPLLGKRGSAIEEYSDEEEETAIDGNNARGTGAGRRRPLERSAGSVHDIAFEISTLSEIGVEGRATGCSELEEPAEGDCKSEQALQRPMDVFPSRLLDLCNQDAPLTFLAFLPNGCQDRSKWLAHGHHSEVFHVASPRKRAVLKVIPVTGDFTEQRIDAIAAAIECCVKLSMLRHGVRYRTPNFVETQRIACVFDQFPKWLLRGDHGLGSRDFQAGQNQCFLTRHFIVLELCYAGKPLSRITLRSAVQGRSLVLQASCCMAVAERALGLRHLGANPDKLLVTTTDAASLEYHLPGRSPLTIDSAGLRVHVAGCLSFALGPEAKEEDDTPTSPPRVKSALSNAPSHHSSEAQRFRGNVAWLGAVVDSVVRKLRSEVPEHRARAERGLVEELLMLQRRLQQCDSLGEFFDTLSI